MVTKPDFKSKISKNLKNVQETDINPIPIGEFVVQSKEPKPRANAKNNFPLYMEKEGADRLLALAREKGVNRNDLIIQMINYVLTSIGEKHVK